jgi:endogenous inhibitor of DNA gyrase (YacG/DUF329 family)
MPSSTQCPTCQRPVEWTPAFPYRPFCSERCKLVDLGAWASGTHAIPGDQASEDEIDDDARNRKPM